MHDNPLVAFSMYVTEAIEKFIERLRDEHDISEEVLRDIFRDIEEKGKEEEERREATQAEGVEPVAKKSGKSVKKKELSDGQTCIQPMKSGPNKGHPCGANPSAKSTTGKFCGRHLRAEAAYDHVEIDAKNADDKIDEKGMIIRRNKNGNFVFGETGLVFKSDKEKIIIGRQLNDGTVVNLTDEDIKLCKKNKLKHKLAYFNTVCAVEKDTHKFTAKIALF